MHHPLLELSGVSFTYGDGVVLRDVDLTVRAGAFLGIVGPSGAGKSTLLRLMEGSLRPSAGSVVREHEGHERLRLGVVPQLEAIDWTFPITVEEIVLLGTTGNGRRLPWASRAMRAEAGEMLEKLGIRHLAGRHIRNLSGGQQQRAFIAKALAGEPELLVLDEPTTGVDVEAQEAIAALLQRLRSELAMTILYVSHEFGAVEEFVKRIVLVRGEIVFDGPPSALPGVWHDPSHTHA